MAMILCLPYADLLVLGCGPKMELMPQALQQWLASHGIAVECLNTVSYFTLAPRSTPVSTGQHPNDESSGAGQCSLNFQHLESGGAEGGCCTVTK